MKSDLLERIKKVESILEKKKKENRKHHSLILSLSIRCMENHLMNLKQKLTINRPNWFYVDLGIARKSTKVAGYYTDAKGKKSPIIYL